MFVFTDCVTFGKSFNLPPCLSFVTCKVEMTCLT